jgi:hypothetical protein
VKPPSWFLKVSFFAFFIVICPSALLFGSNPDQEKALRKLSMPGILLNLEERCVDVNATVCLREGLLELLACTKNSKEHESILVMNARPMQVHTALLLLGSRPGTPAMH